MNYIINELPKDIISIEIKSNKDNNSKIKVLISKLTRKEDRVRLQLMRVINLLECKVELEIQDYNIVIHSEYEFRAIDRIISKYFETVIMENKSRAILSKDLINNIVLAIKLSGN